MLRILKNPKKSPATDTTFENIITLKQTGIDMLIALNMTNKPCLIGPEVNIDSKILVTKESPHFFFNPLIVLGEDELQNETKDCILHISYKNHQGEDSLVTITDECGSIRKSIDQLYNGIARANKRKV